MLEKTLESPLDCMEVPSVYPKIIGRTDFEAEAAMLGPPDAKS